MRNRALAVIGTAVLLALSGCTTPEPATPTPTAAFSTEEEAFAAAEETYRAYVDALNQVDLSDPETFEGVYEWTTCEANAGERRSLTTMHADGWRVSGDTAIQSLDLGSADRYSGVVTLHVCSDVSAVDVVDENGASVVATDRPTAQASRVTLVTVSASDTGLLISNIGGSSHQCGG